jgi:hypothetical protein
MTKETDEAAEKTDDGADVLLIDLESHDLKFINS